MELYIKKSALLAEIERRFLEDYNTDDVEMDEVAQGVLASLKYFIDTLEVKEVDEQKERMSECPYRKVGCTMYEGTILECNGACSWVVDYPKLKELKAQKGER